MFCYQISTAVAMRELGITSLSSPNEMTLLQRKVYLAQSLGLPLEHGFTWHFCGPYSNDLTAYAIDIIKGGYDTISGMRLAEKHKKIIERVNALEDEISYRGLKISPISWYGALSSVAYCYAKKETKQQTIGFLLNCGIDLKTANAAYDAYIKVKGGQYNGR